MTIKRFPINVPGAVKGLLSHKEVQELLRYSGANSLLEKGASITQRMVVHPEEHMRLDGDSWPYALMHNETYLAQTHSLGTHMTEPAVVAPWLYLVDLLASLRKIEAQRYNSTNEPLAHVLYHMWILVGFVPRADLTLDPIYDELYHNLLQKAIHRQDRDPWNVLTALTFPHYTGGSSQARISDALCVLPDMILSPIGLGDFKLSDSINRYIIHMVHDKYAQKPRREVCDIARMHLIEMLSPKA